MQHNVYTYTSVTICVTKGHKYDDQPYLWIQRVQLDDSVGDERIALAGLGVEVHVVAAEHGDQAPGPVGVTQGEVWVLLQSLDLQVEK